jgi:hypothetical protein
MRVRQVLAPLAAIGLVIAVARCDTGAKAAPPAPTPTPTPAPATPVVEGALRLGTPIEASATQVALADVAKKPESYTGKTFATTGTVTAVCQHMGCWMEIKDDASAAHIKMAGHAFFVPKTASGRKARILAKLEKADSEGACEGEGHEGMAAAGGAASHGEKGEKSTSERSERRVEKRGCRAEAESQLGRPLAKLELVAEGVELM